LQPGGPVRGARQERAGSRVRSGVPAHPDGMLVRLHQIIADAHDLPGLARFRTLAW